MGKLTYSKWRAPTREELAQEYKWEYDKAKAWTRGAWPTLKDFMRSATKGRVVALTPAMDREMEYRSHTGSLRELKDLVSSYQFPRDVDRIVRGIKQGDALPMPIVLKRGTKLRVFGGNTRLDVAEILGVKPKVLIVEVPAVTGGYLTQVSALLEDAQGRDVARRGKMRESVKVSRKYEVPYLAGYSEDGRTVYIDRRLPEVMELKDGRRIGVDHFLLVHETTEKRLLQHGAKYPEAHNEATIRERAAVERAGIRWGEYDTWMQGWITRLLNKGYTSLPPDLDLKPEEDSEDMEILLKIKKMLSPAQQRRFGLID